MKTQVSLLESFSKAVWRKRNAFELGVGMITWKDWGEEEYKSLDRSSPKLRSKRVFLRTRSTLKELQLEVVNHAFWSAANGRKVTQNSMVHNKETSIDRLSSSSSPE